MGGCRGSVAGRTHSACRRCPTAGDIVTTWSAQRPFAGRPGLPATLAVSAAAAALAAGAAVAIGTAALAIPLALAACVFLVRERLALLTLFLYVGLFKEQAVVYSTQVPGDFRDRFVDAFSHAASGGLQVGPGQTGVAEHLPPGVPPQVIQQLQDLFQNVFAHAFVIAMRPSLVVAILVLVVGAVSCLALKHGRTETKPASPAESLVGERVI